MFRTIAIALSTIDCNGRVFLGAISETLAPAYETLPTLNARTVCLIPCQGPGVAERQLDRRSRLLLNMEDRRVLGREIGDHVLAIVDADHRLWLVDPVVVVDCWSALVIDG